jgi:oligopeptide/dipeptide ABC transporter ATP-binding protein
LLSDLPQGCAFAPRCRFVIDACRQARPPLVEVTPAHRSACIRHDIVAEA